jgi:hypothetical protein
MTELRTFVDDTLSFEGQLFLASVPRIRHLTGDGEPLDRAYYLRHRIETVRRIRETARTDALALAFMLREDYNAARKWARYTEQELNHDRLYLADLHHHGYTTEQVLAIPPMHSTVLLLQTLESRIQQLGSLPAVAYSVFVEWNSERASAAAVERTAAELGASYVTGSRAHLGIDVREDHLAVMLEVTAAVMRGRYDGSVLGALLRELGALFRGYFTELHQIALATKVSA